MVAARFEGIHSSAAAGIQPIGPPDETNGWTRSRSALASCSLGSVIFIAGNMPMVSEIAPLLIVIKLEQFDYRGAAAICVMMLGLSFLLLLAINRLQRWSRSWQQ